jgi:polyribonucleotide nucleotidyltransferase
MIDRPIRPLFPEDFMNEVQVQCLVLSTDNQNDPDILAIIGSSAALTLSHAPFQGPIGAARIGYVEGEFVLNPQFDSLAKSDMDVVVCGTAEAVNMIELSGKEVPEGVVTEGIAKGYEICKVVIEMIDELAAHAGVQKKYEPNPIPEELVQLVGDKCGQRIRQAKQIPAKVERGEVVHAIREELLTELCPEDTEQPQYTPDQVKGAFYKTEGKIQRELIFQGKRLDGRGLDEVRPLSMEVGVLPRTHGSAIFSRGETQALVTTTLGTVRDAQIIDGLLDEYSKKFMLHYNFPPFSVGEIRPIRGPGRREIGHGALAEKGLAPMMPNEEDFPYTVRIVADILESNGSTSMATVCGGALSLMDAGVPIKEPVAGVSIGMVSDGDRYVLLTDILGEEDFHGDMDFKVAGTTNGITGIQLDMKVRGISHDRIVEAVEQARVGRLHILEQMRNVLGGPREQISRYAPRMLTLKINPELIGKVIGPGGKTINKIQQDTGATIDIEDDGTIYISCVDADGAEAAKATVEGLTEEVKLGKIYTGKVVSIRDFGAFIEILPDQDGLCHVSELDDKYVKNVNDVCKVGDQVEVKVIAIDDQGRVKLSRKAALRESKSKESGAVSAPGRPRAR